MIFVTVGTHEQPFDRLLTEIDRLKENGTIQEPVMIQSGFSTYEPKYCEWEKTDPLCGDDKKCQGSADRDHAWRTGKLYDGASGRKDSDRCSAPRRI